MLDTMANMLKRDDVLHLNGSNTRVETKPSLPVTNERTHHVLRSNNDYHVWLTLCSKITTTKTSSSAREKRDSAVMP